MAIANVYRRERGRMPLAPARQAGNWKLAYADFLTALVALFLVLWLVNDVPEGNRAAFAGYFRGDTEYREPEAPSGLEDKAIEASTALKASRALMPYRNHVVVSAEGTRVRLDVMDGQARPMFVSGGSDLTPEGVATLSALSDILQRQPWDIEIEGHTDAFPATGVAGDNWTLSLRRAGAARRLLVEAGTDPVRIKGVVGFANTQPLRAEEPHLAANRRVTLVLQVTE